MLFFALDLSLDPCACLAPLVHKLLGFLISSLLLKLAILLLPPHWLKFLLEKLISWIVVEVAGATLKSILVLKFDFLWLLLGLVHGPERGKWQFLYSFLSLGEPRLLTLGESRSWASCITTYCACNSADIVLRAQVSVHKPHLVVCVFSLSCSFSLDLFLLVLFNMVHSRVEALQAPSFDWLDSNARWWNLFVLGALRILKLRIFKHRHGHFTLFTGVHQVV